MTVYEHRQTGFWIIYAIGLPALIILAVVVVLASRTDQRFVSRFGGVDS